MCLAVPMTVVELGVDGVGVVELEGVRRSVRLELLDQPAVGDIVIVHAGYAIERLDVAEAEARLALFEALADRYTAGIGRPVRLVAEPPKRPVAEPPKRSVAEPPKRSVVEPAGDT